LCVLIKLASPFWAAATSPQEEWLAAGRDLLSRKKASDRERDSVTQTL